MIGTVRARTFMKTTVVACLMPLFFAGSAFPAKSVILLIPDGTGASSFELARLAAGGRLAQDKYTTAKVTTYEAEGPVTDSAAAATAMAAGFKTNGAYVSCLPEKAGMKGVVIDASRKKAPVATVLEAARLAGKATGLIATSNIQHATPASFSSHGTNRDDYEALGEQQVYQGIDVVLGGGSKYLAGRRDKEDLTGVIKNNGYDYVTTTAAMSNSVSPRIWGMFAANDLQYDVDRDPAIEPSLEQMTQKAISVLSQDPDGFFLLVEGSKADWAAHSHDAAGVVSELLAFDKAVAAALKYAEKRSDTAVIVVPDHGNGGLKISGAAKKELSAAFGPGKITREKLEEIMDTTGGKLTWSANGHTPEEVLFSCFDPAGKCPKGTIDNTGIAGYMADTMGLDLQAVTDKLFVPTAGLAKDGINVSTDTADPENPVLVLERSARRLRLPANKNIALSGGRSFTLDGVTVFNGQGWYFSADALKILDGPPTLR